MALPMTADTTSGAALNRVRDRRRHKRVPVEVGGRFLNEHGEDHNLQTINVSCSGAMIRAHHALEAGSTIVCYFDDLGRVAATVIRATADGFAVQFNISQFKRDKLADRLTWVINRGPLGLDDERASDRFAAGGPALITLKDGRQIQCRVLDLSLAGAGFESEGAVPMVGDRITAGNLRGEVVRVSENTFAIRYSW